MFFNLEFKGIIRLRLEAQIPAELYSADRYAVFTSGDKANRIAFTEATAVPGKENTYYFYQDVFIKQFADNYTVTFADAEGKEVFCVDSTGKVLENGVTMSVKTYCEYMIEKGSTEAMRRLAEATLNYGIAAQIYSKYGNWSGLTVPEKVTKVTAEDLKNYRVITSGQEPDGVKVTMNVNFEADNALFVRFALPEGKTDADYIFSGVSDKVVKEEDRYAMRRPGIRAKDLAKEFSFTIADATTSFTVTGSEMAYCRGIISGSSFSTEMKNLAKAIYLYYVAADAYIQ